MTRRTQIDELFDRPIAYHRAFAKISNGGVTAGVFLSQAWYWSARTNDPDGWFYKSAKEWEEETALTLYEQQTVRKHLKAVGVLEEKRKGVPATLHFRVNKERVYELLRIQIVEKPKTEIEEIPQSGNTQNNDEEKPKTTLRNSSNLHCGNPQIFNTETTTESTTETTPESKKTGAPAPDQRTDAQKKGDLVDGYLHYQGKKPSLDVSEYPEDVVPVLVEFFRLWKIEPPSKKVDASAYKLWIKDARAVKAACGEFGLVLMHRYFKKWKAEGPKLTIACPGSLTNLLLAEAGLARQEKDDRRKPVGIEAYDPAVVAAFQQKLNMTRQTASVST